MKILIACEFSGVVRRAFRGRGHDAWSCDLMPTEDGDPHHLRCDVITVMNDGWDMMVAFPPCTHLSSSGARWFREKRADGRQATGIAFFMAMVNAPIERIAIENPIGIMSSHYRKPDQIIQPWQYGHGETKATCLWLVGLPPLTPTDVVPGRDNRVHREPPGPDRWKKRSVTYNGIARAMSLQWSTP